MEKKQFPLAQIQKLLALQDVDGWLLYDFRCHNTIAIEFLNIDPELLLSRRFFYWIPKSGTPTKIVHKIESEALAHLPGEAISYESWQSLEDAVNLTLKGQKRICMEHSPKGALPVIAKLDAGTYEWLSDKGIAVVSSWPIVQHFIAHWTDTQAEDHRQASKLLIDAYRGTWELIKESFTEKRALSELDLQQHILDFFTKEQLRACHPPIVAMGCNSALPHYAPTKTAITPDSLLLIDLWAKKSTPFAPYADITQVAYLGKKPPAQMTEVYGLVLKAQDAAIDYLQKKVQSGQEVMGFELDDVCRSVIRQGGYADQFVHRTGHNIHTDLHGPGPNIDNFETHDTRPLMPRTCYSIEPGIYLPGLFGIRLECNIFIKEDNTVEVTGKSLPNLPCISN
ncbi:MAG: M24 family metallopeptidase [Verrucomicrobia bacterium]|nr:M24 family metallopeptidase [Verrucomicrobiota bacterium]